MGKKMTRQGTNIDLERPEWTLTRFGADFERWPDEERQTLEPLIMSSSDACAMLEEARALDKLLDMAPVAAETAELKNKILDAAKAELTRSEPLIIPFRPRQNLGAGVWRTSWTWPSVAALAASLVFGIYIGANGLIDPALTNGFDVASAEESIASALPGFSFDEDVTLSEDFL